MTKVEFLRASALGALVAIPAMCSGAEYAVDPMETRASFVVAFWGLIPIHGEFSRVSGTLRFDDGKESGAIDIAIDATSLTGGGETARGPDFFHIAKYPSIEFRSRRFAFESGVLKRVEGELVLTGQRHAVTLTTQGVQCETPSMAMLRRCKGDAEVTVKRSQFGMTGWKRSVSDDVTIRIRLVAIETPASTTARAPQ
ncbi:MAG: YceI family protein [Betaproteobacteria bacterium]|nr:YceI family protein [Betaproteobacteria bacterium]